MKKILFPSRIKTCADIFHSNLVKNGCLQMLHLGNYLLRLYLKDSHFDSATKVFDEIPERDVRTWTILISELSRHGYHRAALDYFSGMQMEGIIAPNAFTLSSVIKCCVCVGRTGFRMGKAIHGWMIRTVIDGDVPLNNAILDLYVKSGRFTCVKKFFELMDDKDTISWNIVMAAHLSNCEMEECLDFFKRLPFKSVSSWNTILNGLLHNGFAGDALKLCYEMARVGPSFDKVSFSISLILASSLKSLKLGRQIHCHILRIGINEDSYVCTSLIDMYCKCREMEKASVVFGEFQSRCSDGFRDDKKAQTISWSTMIAGYVQHGMIKNALVCFSSIIHKQLEVDLSTLTSILTACAETALLELGQQIHAHTHKSGHGNDIILCSSLIDMYAKCGKLNDACSVFRETHTRNVVLYSVMVQSFANHGWGREAIQLFELMQSEGIQPNAVSFVALLTACSHTGLIVEGCKYFRMMIEVYHILPEIEHFACMVDLLGRGGHLKEIKDFVYQTGISHLQEVWKAYLSSCWIHKNAEMANWVSKKLLELEPREGHDPYHLLSNTFSANHVWEEAAQSRSLMHEKEVKKFQGQSWI